MGYPLAVATFVFGIIIQSSTGTGFASSTAANSASGYKTALIVCGVLLLLNAGVAMAQAVIYIYGIVYGCGGSDYCLGIYLPTGAWGCVCAVAMIVLAGVAMDMGITLDKLSKATRGTGQGIGGGQVLNQGQTISNGIGAIPMATQATSQQNQQQQPPLAAYQAPPNYQTENKNQGPKFEQV
jgi:hypothetical protein